MQYIISQMSCTQVNTGNVQLYTTGVTAHKQYIISQLSCTQLNAGVVQLFTTGLTASHRAPVPLDYCPGKAASYNG